MASITKNCGEIDHFNSLAQADVPFCLQQDYIHSSPSKFTINSFSTKQFSKSQLASCSVAQPPTKSNSFAMTESNGKEIDTVYHQHQQDSVRNEITHVIPNNHQEKNTHSCNSNSSFSDINSNNNNGDNINNVNASNENDSKDNTNDNSNNDSSNDDSNNITNNSIIHDNNAIRNDDKKDNGITSRQHENISNIRNNFENKLPQPLLNAATSAKEASEAAPSAGTETSFSTLTQLPFITAPLRSQLSPETMKSLLPLTNRHTLSSTNIVSRPTQLPNAFSPNAIVEQDSLRNVTTELFLKVAGSSCLSSKQYPLSPANDDCSANFSPITSQLCRKDYSLLEQRKERFPAPPVGMLQNPEVYGINVAIGGELIKPQDVKIWELPDLVKLQRLRDRLVQFMSENHLKQADICRFTGLGAPYLSFMVKDPTISNFSSKRRVEVYSVLKAFFEKIDNEEVTLDDIARLVLISKAAARAVNSRKKNALVGEGQEKTIRRRRRGRPRVLERSREEQRFSFQDFLAATALSNSALWGNASGQANSESVKFENSNQSSRIPVFFSNHNKDSNQFSAGEPDSSEKDNATTSGMNNRFNFILEELRKNWLLQSNHNRPTIPPHASASPDTNNSTLLPSSNYEDYEEAIFKILVSLLSRCDSSQLKRITESFLTHDTYKKNTDRPRSNDFTNSSQLSPALLRRILDAMRLQKLNNHEFCEDISNSFLLKVPQSLNDTLDDLSGERFSNSNTSDEESSTGTADDSSFQQNITTVKNEFQSDSFQQRDLSSELKQQKRKKSFSSISSTGSKAAQNSSLCDDNNNSCEKIHQQSENLIESGCGSFNKSLPYEIPPTMLNALRSHFESLIEASKSSLKTDTQQQSTFDNNDHSEYNCCNTDLDVRLSPSILEQGKLIAQQQGPKILNMFMALLESYQSEPTVSKDEHSSFETTSKYLDSGRTAPAFSGSELIASNSSDLLGQGTNSTTNTSSFSYNNTDVLTTTTWTNPIRFGKGWTREVDCFTIKKSTEHNSLTYDPMNQQVCSTSTTCTDDEDDSDSLLSFSGHLCSVRLQWTHGSMTGKEDLLWDITDTGSAVETFIEQYVREHNLPEYFTEQLCKSFREEILAKQSFENMFLATTQHLAVLLKQPYSKYLPGMKRKIILDFTFNGTRNIDAIDWNLSNTASDAKSVLKDLIRDSDMTISCLPQLLSAFLRALAREKLAFMHECTMTLLGTVQAKFIEHSDESYNNGGAAVNWNNVDTQRRKRGSTSLYPNSSKSSEEFHAVSSSIARSPVASSSIEDHEALLTSFEVPQTKRSCVNQQRVYEHEKVMQIDDKELIPQSLSKSFFDSQSLFNLKLQDNKKPNNIVSTAASSNECPSAASSSSEAAAKNFLIKRLQQESIATTEIAATVAGERDSSNLSYAFLPLDSPGTAESKIFENSFEGITMQKQKTLSSFDDSV